MDPFFIKFKETVEREDLIWSKINEPQSSTNNTGEEEGDGFLDGVKLFAPSLLKKAFENNGDFMEKGRAKVIHKLGSVAKFIFKSTNGNYLDFKGFIRLSNAVDSSAGVVYPSFSIKILNDYDQRSINFNIGKSFDGQADEGGGPDFNFFRDHELYPFSNELPDTAFSIKGILFRGLFRLAVSKPNFVPIEGIKNRMVEGARAPRRLVFVAPEAIRKLMPSDKYVEPRGVFAEIPENSKLFDVYASSGLGSEEIKIGEMFMSSKFVSSSFGDKNLYFRHEK